MTDKERSYLLPGLTPSDRKLLRGVPRDAALADEIAYLRLRIRKLAEDASEPLPDAASARGRRDADQLLVRMLELLTRMVSTQAKLGDEPEDQWAAIADLARRRLIAAGLAKAGAARGEAGEEAG